VTKIGVTDAATASSVLTFI